MGSVRAPQVHDLIRIDSAVAAHWDAPSWVRAALERAPWVVVRRACLDDAIGACPANDIPIGVRGATRAERFAARIESAAICELIAPAELVARIGAGSQRLARAARLVDAAARWLHLRWGPAGAYGFELASGAPAAHARSDLDIVICGNASRAALGDFAARCTQIERTTGVRIDADVLFAGSGVALVEFVSGAPVVLAKTPAGPLLVTNPALNPALIVTNPT